MIEAHKRRAESAPQGSPGGGVAGLFDKIKSLCNEELVNSVNGVFEFHLEGKEPGVWHLDLKNNAGKQIWSNFKIPGHFFSCINLLLPCSRAIAVEWVNDLSKRR